MRLTHEVEVNAVVYEVILTRQDVLRCREVDTESLASSLDLFVLSSQTNQIVVELLQVLLCDLGGISCRVACDEDRSHNITVLLLDIVNHAGHLVQLFRADIRAVCESKVNQRVFSLEILLGERLAVLVDQLEGATDQRTADTLAVFGDALAGHALLLVAEVEAHTDAGRQKQDSGLPAEGTEAVTRLCFFYSLVSHSRALGECAGGGLADAGRDALGEALRRRAGGEEGALQRCSRQ